jgi:hypothetical protein
LRRGFADKDVLGLFVWKMGGNFTDCKIWLEELGSSYHTENRNVMQVLKVFVMYIKVPKD